jgi:hypothetical protein
MIDIDRINEECKILEVDPDIDQLVLQTVKGKDSEYGIGGSKHYPEPETDFVDFTYPELEYTNKVIQALGLFRARYMVMKKKSCYTYHWDPTPRVHIPLVTNPDCFMILDDKLERYPADGNAYLVDTRKMHTFVNASRDSRIHIVGNVLDMNLNIEERLNEAGIN